MWGLSRDNWVDTSLAEEATIARVREDCFKAPRNPWGPRKVRILGSTSILTHTSIWANQLGMDLTALDVGRQQMGCAGSPR